MNKVSEIWASHQENLTVQLKKEILNLNNNTTSKQEELIGEFKKLGECFTLLNSGVSDLLIWQKNYKETIEISYTQSSGIEINVSNNMDINDIVNQIKNSL